MTPINYAKIKDNEYDFDNMTLVKIISHNNQIIYFFIVEYVHKFRGKLILQKDLLEVPEEDYINIISQSYKIL